MGIGTRSRAPDPTASHPISIQTKSRYILVTMPFFPLICRGFIMNRRVAAFLCDFTHILLSKNKSTFKSHREIEKIFTNNRIIVVFQKVVDGDFFRCNVKFCMKLFLRIRKIFHVVSRARITGT